MSKPTDPHPVALAVALEWLADGEKDWEPDWESKALAATITRHFADVIAKAEALDWLEAHRPSNWQKVVLRTGPILSIDWCNESFSPDDEEIVADTLLSAIQRAREASDE